MRRTFATNLAALGTPIHVTEKLLNHVSGTVSGVAAVYNRHAYMDEMRAAIDAWEKRLSVILAQHNNDDSNASPAALNATRSHISGGIYGGRNRFRHFGTIRH